MAERQITPETGVLNVEIVQIAKTKAPCINKNNIHQLKTLKNKWKQELSDKIRKNVPMEYKPSRRIAIVPNDRSFAQIYSLHALVAL